MQNIEDLSKEVVAYLDFKTKPNTAAKSIFTSRLCVLQGQLFPPRGL